MDYRNSGVDIEAGYESVELMKKYVKRTMRPEVLGGLGGFSGAFSMEAIKGMEEPVLLTSTPTLSTARLPSLPPRQHRSQSSCLPQCGRPSWSALHPQNPPRRSYRLPYCRCCT